MVKDLQGRSLEHLPCVCSLSFLEYRSLEKLLDHEGLSGRDAVAAVNRAITGIAGSITRKGVSPGNRPLMVVLSAGCSPRHTCHSKAAALSPSQRRWPSWRST